MRKALTASNGLARINREQARKNIASAASEGLGFGDFIL